MKSFHIFQVGFSTNDVKPIKKLLATFTDLTTLTNLIGYYYEISNQVHFMQLNRRLGEDELKN